MAFYTAISGVIKKSKQETEAALRKFVEQNTGHQTEIPLKDSKESSCIISQEKEGACVVYPGKFPESLKASEFISGELKCPVFSFFIFSGDNWMFSLYNNGVFVDQFNPVVDRAPVPQSEKDAQRGNATLVAELTGVEVDQVANYFKAWTDELATQKAYPEDEHNYEEWQFVDFLKKIGLGYPLVSFETMRGSAYEIEMEGIPMSLEKEIEQAKADGTLKYIEREEKVASPAEKTTQVTNAKKPWWKFW